MVGALAASPAFHALVDAAVDDALRKCGAVAEESNAAAGDEAEPGPPPSAGAPVLSQAPPPVAFQPGPQMASQEQQSSAAGGQTRKSVPNFPPSNSDFFFGFPSVPEMMEKCQRAIEETKEGE